MAMLVAVECSLITVVMERLQAFLGDQRFLLELDCKD
jgi:hypothetical protein